MVISRKEIFQSAPAILRGSGVGFALGILPGCRLDARLVHGLRHRATRVEEPAPTSARGAIEGVAAPESANNAAANANFVPTLSLGIPGGATTAVLLGAFTIYGLQPGPLLFETQPELVWGLLVSFFIGNVLLLVLNLPLAPVFAQMLRIPYGYLYPIILLTSIIGAYSVSNNMFSVWIVRRLRHHRLDHEGARPAGRAARAGLVLGPLFEKSLVQTSALSEGNFGVMVQSPAALGVLLFAAALIVVPPVIGNIRKRRARAAAAGDSGARM